jgi:hypothetical protein
MEDSSDIIIGFSINNQTKLQILRYNFYSNDFYVPGSLFLIFYNKYKKENSDKTNIDRMYTFSSYHWLEYYLNLHSLDTSNDMFIFYTFIGKLLINLKLDEVTHRVIIKKNITRSEDTLYTKLIVYVLDLTKYKEETHNTINILKNLYDNDLKNKERQFNLFFEIIYIFESSDGYQKIFTSKKHDSDIDIKTFKKEIENNKLKKDQVIGILNKNGEFEINDVHGNKFNFLNEFPNSKKT